MTLASAFQIRPGRPLPFGVTPVPGGLNFAVHSQHATAVTLVLFRQGTDEVLAELPFPAEHRVGDVHAMTVLGVSADEVDYGYRVAGPFDPERGHRFDPGALLVDPYARRLVGRDEWGVHPNTHAATPWRSRPVAPDPHRAPDRAPDLAPADLVVYELHVRGFTRHPSSGVAHPGTFAGLVAKIPHLVELGVNCVELMPVFEFDEFQDSRFDADTGEWRYNYWGYNTVGFFAPKASYAAGDPVAEFRDLVRALHAAGIRVVLDVVFNHTAEGDHRGPTISFRGLDNARYYLLGPRGEYRDYTGTGNTLNCNDPVVRGFVLDCLRYWVTEFGVDGFRFDLAAVLVRGPDGAPLANPPLVEALAEDPVLRDCLLIAEAWDAAGLYQVGSFPDYRRFSEWNGRYRDALRRFLKGDPGAVGELATRFVGSPDLYPQRGPLASVNFVTAHDGFTLADLVSYDERHNDANGEGGRDGERVNHSWNCGVEGPTDDPAVLALRARQVRNALVLLLTSRGIPMLLAGDEFGRSQGGNNNAYCHDGPLSWLDWDLAERNADLVRFTGRVLAFRRAHPVLRGTGHLTAEQVTWHGRQPSTPDWTDGSRLLAVELREGPDRLYLAANAHWEPVRLELPAPPDGLAWHRFADTSLGADAASEPGREPRLADQSALHLAARSTVVLITRPLEET